MFVAIVIPLIETRISSFSKHHEDFNEYQIKCKMLFVSYF